MLDNVDPNPENYVSAGVIQTKGQQVGCLLRLEPNAQAQVQATVVHKTLVSHVFKSGSYLYWLTQNSSEGVQIGNV